jgi:tetratricopeptide (TPR) repeat protein
MLQSGRSGRVAIALAAVLAAASPAAAQPAPAPAPPASAQPDYAAAKQHYQAAEQAAAKGDHATAAREYGIAYDITKDPVLFYKIAQSYQQAGDCTSARAYYGRYLKEGNPSEEFKTKTEEAMRTCGQAQPAQPEPQVGAAPPAGSQAPAAASDQEAVGAAAVSAPPRSLEEEEPSWQKTAAWTSVGIAVALVTTGAVLGLSAASREEDVQNLVDFRDAEGQPATYTGATRERYNDLISEGDRLESLAVVAFAASGVAAASAALFFVLDARAAHADDLALRPTAGPGGVGLSWGGRF